MEYNDQDFLAEIRALIDQEDGAPAEEAPAAVPPAPEEKKQEPAPEPHPRRERRKPSAKKSRKRSSDPQPSSPDFPPARRRRPPKEPRSFPWALAFLTVLVAAGLIYAGMQYRNDLNAPATEPTEVPPSQTETEPLAERQTVTIAAVGDVMITDELLAAAQQPDGTYDFSRALLYATPHLSEADVAVANLDLNFCGEPYGSDSHSAPYALAEALAGAGLDIAQVANSYSIANGIDGLSATLTAVRQAGMEPLGAYSDEASYQESRGITLCEINGFRIAFIAFTKGMDNLSLPEGHAHCVNLLYKDYDTTYSEVDTEGITAVLEAAAAQRPDITIAMVHWGSEYSKDVSKSQKTIRSLLLNGGVDVILGTHSHRIGSLEIETDKEGSSVTAYSLGNFYGDDSHAGTQTSLILQLEFTMDNLSGKAKLTDVSYVPLYIAAPEQSGAGIFEILDLDTAIALKEQNYVSSVKDAVYDTLVSARQSIASALGDSIEQWKSGQ